MISTDELLALSRQLGDVELVPVWRAPDVIVLLVRTRPSQAAVPVEAQEDEAIPDAADLTKRERQILDLLGTGMTARAIGTVLGISHRTVSKHLEHAYAKTGLHDRLLASGRGLRTPVALHSRLAG